MLAIHRRKCRAVRHSNGCLATHAIAFRKSIHRMRVCAAHYCTGLVMHLNISQCHFRLKQLSPRRVFRVLGNSLSDTYYKGNWTPETNDLASISCGLHKFHAWLLLRVSVNPNLGGNFHRKTHKDENTLETAFGNEKLDRLHWKTNFWNRSQIRKTDAKKFRTKNNKCMHFGHSEDLFR